MLRTWDQNRAEDADWLEPAQNLEPAQKLEHAQKTEAPADPLAPWRLRVDLLLYAAAVGFVVCVIVILVG